MSGLMICFHFTEIARALGAKKTEEGAASARRSTRIQTSVIEISFPYFSLYVCLSRDYSIFPLDAAAAVCYDFPSRRVGGQFQSPQ